MILKGETVRRYFMYQTANTLHKHLYEERVIDYIQRLTFVQSIEFIIYLVSKFLFPYYSTLFYSIYNYLWLLKTSSIVSKYLIKTRALNISLIIIGIRNLIYTNIYLDIIYIIMLGLYLKKREMTVSIMYKSLTVLYSNINARIRKRIYFYLAFYISTLIISFFY